MLCHLEDEPVLYSFDFECVEDGRDLSFELHVHHCADDLTHDDPTCEI